jgi:hypothetical protein
MEIAIELAVAIAAIVCTILGCTWKISGKLSGMDTSLKITTERTEASYQVLIEHTKDCDLDRVKLSERVDGLGHRLETLEG